MSPSAWVLIMLLVVNGKALETERLGTFESEAACLEAVVAVKETQSFRDADASWSLALPLLCFPLWD